MLGNSKILTKENDWYYQIDPNSYYEKDLENAILAKMNSVYPTYIAEVFKLTIESKYGNSDPDIVMIKEDYSDWIIVEVEMDRHPLMNHVVKQVKVFVSGKYDPEEISNYLLDKNPDLDKTKLIEMIRNHDPRVMVIVNNIKKDWKRELKRNGAILSVFQIYKGTNGFDVYRVEGETPYIQVDSGHCKYVQGKNDVLQVFPGNAIDEQDGTILEITYNQVLTKWTLKKDNTKSYLVNHGDYNVLPRDKDFVVSKDINNNYFLRIN